VNSTVASNAQGDFGLMTAAEFAGGGVLHCSIYPRGNLDLIFAPSGVGGTLQVRVYNSSGAIVVNPALPISARIDYFGGPPSSVLRPGNEVDVS
jgi:hypothetical protein